MTTPADGDYTIVITRPDGSGWGWTGYADNQTDALTKAIDAWTDDIS